MANVQISDAELVRRFQRGDEAAFSVFVGRFQDRVYRLALVWLRDGQQAADASQEVFLRAYRGLGRFRFRSAPFTWLYRATRNVCNEFNRQPSGTSLEHEPVDDTRSAEDMMSVEQGARRVRAAIEHLPARQREVVLLRVFEELSVADTARAMGCRPGTVKALLHKAMASMRQVMANREIEEISQ